MTIKKAISDMSRDELEGMLISIHEALWDPEINWEDGSWDPDTIEAAADVFILSDLHPYYLKEYSDERSINETV